MSLRLHLLGAALRPLMRFQMGRARDPYKLRRHFDGLARLAFRPVPHGYALSQPYPAGGADKPGLWISPGARRRLRPVILYLHGGGYLMGSPDTHQHLVARLCRLSGLGAYVPAYSLAPEHPLPAALDDARAAHAYLLRLGHAPGDIILGGDSAGGGLALSLLAELCARGQHPAAAFAWSPFCDQTFSGGSVQENDASDHFFPAARVHELRDWILGDIAAEDPRVSPLFAQFTAPPPVLLQVSASELLRDDSYRMAEVLRRDGGTVEVQTWENAPHVWHMLDGWIPEARAAIADTASFITRHGASAAT